MEIGKPFKDLTSYLNGMNKTLYDKLFFVDKLDLTKKYLFVDFGCADGTLLMELSEILGNSFIYAGYDVSQSMINLAKEKCPADSNIFFTTDYSSVLEYIKKHTNYVPVLILSSVIHEIFSYLENSKVDFWNDIIYSTLYSKIIIRDMMPSKSSNRVSNPIIVNKIRTNIKYSDELRSFEKIWGSIDNNTNLIHFLLKYKYKVNWEREVNENYFCFFIEDFNTLMSKKYRLDYFEKFKIPYLERIWYDDFQIVIDDTTHIKAIYNLK